MKGSLAVLIAGLLVVLSAIPVTAIQGSWTVLGHGQPFAEGDLLWPVVVRHLGPCAILLDMDHQALDNPRRVMHPLRMDRDQLMASQRDVGGQVEAAHAVFPDTAGDRAGPHGGDQLGRQIDRVTGIPAKFHWLGPNAEEVQTVMDPTSSPEVPVLLWSQGLQLKR